MYKLILPFRYLIKRRISLLAVLAVALCVFVVVVVMTVLSGLTGELKRKYHSFIGDCVVSSKSLVGFVYYQEFMDVLDSADFVEAASAVIKSPALMNVTTHTGEVYRNWTKQLMGIDPVRHSRATGFGNWLKYHRDNVSQAFAPAYDPDLPGCVSGILEREWQSFLAATEGLPKITFETSCFPLTAKGALAKAGAGLVSTKTFYLSDRASVGLPRVDSDIVYVPFAQAQRLCGMDIGEKRVNEIHIKFKPNVDLQSGCTKVTALWDDFKRSKGRQRGADLLGRVRVQSWKTYQRAVISALETEQIMMVFVFALIGVIAVFIVFVVVYMIVSHKSKDIGILRSVGASRGEIMRLFLGFAVLLGLIGTAVGSIGGWWFLVRINDIEAWLFKHFEFQLWDRTVYAMGDIPNRIDIKLFSAIIISGIAASVFGALVPSIQAARRRPVETLQVSQL